MSKGARYGLVHNKTKGVYKHLTRDMQIFLVHITKSAIFALYRLTDQGVKYITDSHSAPKLRELNMTNCLQIGDVAIVNIHKR